MSLNEGRGKGCGNRVIIDPREGVLQDMPARLGRPFHRGHVMPKENLGGVGGQSHPPDNKAAPAGRRPMTPLERTAARPARNDSIPM